MMILLDHSGRTRRFCTPEAVVAAHAPDEVPGALAALEAARASGKYAAGYFSYELGYLLEPRLKPLLPPNRAVPLLWFGIFERAEEGLCATSARAYAGPLVHEWDEPAYTTRFARIHEWIAAGDIYQANLSFRSRFNFLGDPLALYLSLRAQSGAAHCAYIDDGKRQILSLSPELFFDLSADGRLTARPMKGTAARGTDSASDEIAKANLQNSAKNRAENLMIVDLLRNDLGRVAQTGSVKVANLFEVETYPTVHQMVSTINAQLKPSMRVEELVRALFPCGSVTGAPKIRAMEIVREMESSPRDIYCGAIGHFAPDGSANFNVAIRTLTINGNQGELGIGGAIVHDSTAQSEYAECLLKARYYEAARKPLELIETLRHAPGEGFTRLELHLARMSRSAAAFGIPFDTQAAMRALESALLPTPARMRLTLNEEGKFNATSAPLSKDVPPLWKFAVSPIRVVSTDQLQRYKTTWREIYDNEHARAAQEGYDEIIFLNEKDEVVEGSRTNIFARIDGALVTSPLSSGALDGCLRRALIEEGKCVERILTFADLVRANEIFLGNSLRGLIHAISHLPPTCGEVDARSEASTSGGGPLSTSPSTRNASRSDLPTRRR